MPFPPVPTRSQLNPVRSYRSISTGPRLRLSTFRNKDTFSRWGVVSPSPNP
jgi:hypothetical protein